MSEINEFLKRVSKKTGFSRKFYLEKNIPTQVSNIVVIVFFGNLDSLFILSSFLLNNIKEKNPEKYYILCSWPGFSNFFPYLDEYWEINDEFLIKKLANNANDFYNTSDTFMEINRNFSEAIDVLSLKTIVDYYHNGFTNKYWEEFKGIRRFFPEVPSTSLIAANYLGQISKLQKKVVVYPSLKMKSWQNNKTDNLSVGLSFWEALVDKLIDEGYSPIIFQNQFTYDMSKDFHDRCLCVNLKNGEDTLALLRASKCVLDVHTGINKFALAARSPFICVTERKIYVDGKSFEIDDLCLEGIPHQYIFTFSTQLMSGDKDDWDVSLLNNIIKRLEVYYNDFEKSELPSTNNKIEDLSYDRVRSRKSKRIGLTFLKRNKAKNG